MVSKNSFFSKLDGRWFLGGSHFGLLLISIMFFSLQRSVFQILSCCVTVIITEYFFYKFSAKNKYRSIYDSLFSAMTEAFGLLILVRSGFDWAYVIFGFIAVASKYLILVDEKRHAFNPTNFAIIAGLVIMPREYFEVRGDEFNRGFYPIIHVLCFGLAAVYLGRTWRIVAAYFSSIIVFSLILSQMTGDSLIYFLGPELGAIGLIFMFLMITDPKTTPQKAHYQFIFGSVIALLAYIFKYYEMFYASFYSLFVVTLFRSLFILMKAKLFPA